MKVKEIPYNRIPKSVQLFGRTIETVDDSEKLSLLGRFGEARSAENVIAIAKQLRNISVKEDELKMTYLHEMIHFILIFTGYDAIIRESKIDIEQFIELLSSAIYQYEKTAEY